MGLRERNLAPLSNYHIPPPSCSRPGIATTDHYPKKNKSTAEETTSEMGRECDSENGVQKLRDTIL